MNTRTPLYEALPPPLGGVDHPPPPHTVTAGAVARALPAPPAMQQRVAERLEGRALSLAARPMGGGGGSGAEAAPEQRARGGREAAAATRSQRRRARRAAAAGGGGAKEAPPPAAGRAGGGGDHAAAVAASASATAVVLGEPLPAATAAGAGAAGAGAASRRPLLPVAGAAPPHPPLSKQARRRAFRAAEAALPPFPPAVVASLSALWRAYAAEAVGPPPGSGGRPNAAATERWGERLARLDLHGAGVTVVAAADPGLVGVTGVVVAETEGLLRVVTTPGGGRPGGRVLALAKGVTVVEVAVPDGGGGADVRVRLVMPCLRFRASERSVRKFKRKHVVLF